MSKLVKTLTVTGWLIAARLGSQTAPPRHEIVQGRVVGDAGPAVRIQRGERRALARRALDKHGERRALARRALDKHGGLTPAARRAHPP